MVSISQTVQAAADRYDLHTNVELDASGSPVMVDEEEQLSYVCDGVGYLLGEVTLGQGKLFITTRRVIWNAEGQSPAVNLSLTYPQIMMHAISKDTSAFPQPCIYLQLDDGSEDMMQAEEEEEEEEMEAAGLSAEVRLVPTDSSKVEEMFKALCDCAALNPDPDNEGEGDFFFDESEVMSGLDDATRAALISQRIENGAMALDADQELEQLVDGDPSRFDDDEFEDDEEEEQPLPAAAPHSNGR